MKGGWEYDEGEVIWTGDLPDTQVLMGSGEATDPLFAGALRRAVIQRKAGVDTVHTTRTIMAGLMMTLEGTVSAVTCRNAIINEFGSDPNKAMSFVDDALATMGSMVTTLACTLHTAVTGESCDPEVHDHRDMALHLGQHMSALIESGLRRGPRCAARPRVRPARGRRVRLPGVRGLRRGGSRRLTRDRGLPTRGALAPGNAWMAQR